MKRSLVLLLCAGLFAGCASVPVYPKYEGDNGACIKDDTSILNTFTRTQSLVQIREIDGVTVQNDSSYCFAPGKHRLGVFAGNDFAESQEYLDFDFQANKKYWLRAKLVGISHVYQIFDVTSEPGVIVAEFKVKAGSSSKPLFIPVIVPR